MFLCRYRAMLPSLALGLRRLPRGARAEELQACERYCRGDRLGGEGREANQVHETLLHQPW